MIQINIMGTRGLPAKHGGFETFVHHLALHLRDKGWRVVVYCQCDDQSQTDGTEDVWNGIHRIHFRSNHNGPLGTIEFDYKCVRHVCTQDGVDLVLGYNTALFNVLQRLRGRRLVMNMDGIEWRRKKWNRTQKIWFYINELIGANIAHVPIADHPEIAHHIRARSFTRPVMIPYGSDTLEDIDPSPLKDLGLESGRYVVSIARIEPENSILELVQASASLPHDIQAVFLGRFEATNAYHRAVQENAPPGTVFPGAIYDPSVVQALRYHALLYLHGHQVGGTNPSLVEALGAGNAVLAHDNCFNRWTAGPEQFYFTDAANAAALLKETVNTPERLFKAQSAAHRRHSENFQWKDILTLYETVLNKEVLKLSKH